MEMPKTPNSQNYLRKNKSEVTFPDFKPQHKTMIMKRVQFQHKGGHTDQWNRIQSPEINSHIYGQRIYDKRAKNI